MPEARPPSVAPAPAPAALEPVSEPDRTDPLATDVARAVRELRVAQGLSERAAARLLGTSQTQLRRMEDPRYLPSLRSLARLAAAYGHLLKVSFESKDRPLPKPVPPRPTVVARPAATRQRTRKRPAKARRR
jgi:transcriptional regulator with XRE-family HTH domain